MDGYSSAGGKAAGGFFVLFLWQLVRPSETRPEHAGEPTAKRRENHDGTPQTATERNRGRRMTNEELIKLIQAGDSEKISVLWEQVERFVELKANRFIRSTPFSDDLAEDLKQAGFLAVVNAAAAFDLDRGFTFLSYLPYHLKVEFYKALGLRSERQRRDPLHTARSLETVLMESDNGDALTIEDTQGAPDPGYEDTEQRIYIDELRAALESEIDLLQTLFRVPKVCARQF